MRLFPRKRFKWKEPRVITQIRDSDKAKSARWWRGPVTVCVITALMMLLWHLSRLNPDKNPPSAGVGLGLAFFLGVFVAYVAPWFVRLSPVFVIITDAAVSVVRANTARYVKWADIVSHEISETDSIPVIRLRKRTGDLIELGIAPDVSLDDLTVFLTGVGVFEADR